MSVAFVETLDAEPLVSSEVSSSCSRTSRVLLSDRVEPEKVPKLVTFSAIPTAFLRSSTLSSISDTADSVAAA